MQTAAACFCLLLFMAAACIAPCGDAGPDLSIYKINCLFGPRSYRRACMSPHSSPFSYSLRVLPFVTMGDGEAVASHGFAAIRCASSSNFVVLHPGGCKLDHR